MYSDYFLTCDQWNDPTDVLNSPIEPDVYCGNPFIDQEPRAVSFTSGPASLHDNSIQIRHCVNKIGMWCDMVQIYIHDFWWNSYKARHESTLWSFKYLVRSYISWILILIIIRNNQVFICVCVHNIYTYVSSYIYLAEILSKIHHHCAIWIFPQCIIIMRAFMRLWILVEWVPF